MSRNPGSIGRLIGRRQDRGMFRLKGCTGLLLLGMAPSVLLAQADLWRPIGPEGSEVRSLIVDPTDSNRVFVGTDQGFYRSSDRGIVWISSNDGLTSLSVETLALHPQDPSLIYAGAGHGLYRSVDGGHRWVPINLSFTNSTIDALIIDPSNPATLYAMTGGSVLVTRDAARSWAPANNGLSGVEVIALAMDVRDPNTFYAGTRFHGVFKSTDGAKSWRVVNEGLTQLEIFAVAVDPEMPQIVYAGSVEGKIYKSENGAGSWYVSSEGVSKHTVQALRIDLQQTQTLYAGTRGGGVFRSLNQGDLWSAINAGLTLLTVRELVIDSRDSDRVYAGTAGGGVFSTDLSNPIPPMQIPTGFLDVPTDQSVVSDLVALQGWAAFVSGAQASLAGRVDLFIDGQPVGALGMGISRPDVQGFLTGQGLNAPENLGFSGSWDSRTVSDGKHSLAIRIVNAAGAGQGSPAEIVSISIVVDNTTTTTTPTTTTTTTTTTTSIVTTTTPTTSTISTSTTTSTLAISTTTTLPEGVAALDFDECNNGTPGGSHTLGVTFKSEKEVREIKFQFLFDSQLLVLDKALPGLQAVNANKELTVREITPSLQEIVLDGNSNPLADGELVYLVLKLRVDAPLKTSQLWLQNAWATPSGGTSYSLPLADVNHDIEILPPPGVNGINPGAGPPGSLMVIDGANFGQCSALVRVEMGEDIVREFKEFSDHRLVLEVPPRAAGVLSVRVRVNDISSADPRAYRVDAAQPFNTMGVEIQAPIILGGDTLPNGAVVDRQTNSAFVADNLNGRILTLDLNSGRTVSEYALPGGGRPANLAVNPRTGQLVVTQLGIDSVVILQRRKDGTLQLLRTLAVGSVPLGVAVDPMANRALVVNSGSNTVALIDLSDLRLITSIPVGNRPVSVTIDSTRHRAYVCNNSDDSVSEIDILEGRNLGEIVGVGTRPNMIRVHAETDTLLVGSDSGLLVYNLESKSQRRLMETESIRALAMHSKRGVATVIGGSGKGRVLTLDLSTLLAAGADPDPSTGILGDLSLGYRGAASADFNPYNNRGLLTYSDNSAVPFGLEGAGAAGFSPVQLPTSLNFPRVILNTGERMGLAISNPSEDLATLQVTAVNRAGQRVEGSAGVTNPVTLSLPKLGSLVKLENDGDFFGDGIGSPVIGDFWVHLTSPHPGLRAFFLTGDFVNSMVGAEESGIALQTSILPVVIPNHETLISVINPLPVGANLLLELIDNEGTLLDHWERNLERFGLFQDSVTNIFSADALGELVRVGGGYVRVRSSVPVRSFQLLLPQGRQDAAGLNGQSAVTSSTVHYFPHFVNRSGYKTRVGLVNVEVVPQLVQVIVTPDGTKTPISRTFMIPAEGRIDLDLSRDLGILEAEGWLEVVGSGRMAGYLTYSTESALAAVVSLPEPRTRLIFSHLAENQDYFSGLSLLNTHQQAATVTIDVYDEKQQRIGSNTRTIDGMSRIVGLLRQSDWIGKAVVGHQQGYVVVNSSLPIHGIEIFGTANGRALANVPAQ